MKTYVSQFDVDGLLAPIIVIVDLGNNFMKVTVLMWRNGEIIKTTSLIEHAYVELTPRGWAQEVEAAKGRLSRRSSARTHAFQIRTETGWKSLKIGDGVATHRDNSPLLGSSKYIKGGIDALLVTALLELLPSDIFPEGHDNIILGIGHPPTEFMQTAHMARLVQPKAGHNVKLPDGTKRKFIVRATMAFDEIFGGLMHMQSTMNTNGQMRDPVSGQFKPNPLKSDDRILMLDAGGKLGSMGWVKYHGGNNFEPLHDSFVPIEGGMITIRDSIRNELSAEFISELRGVTHQDMTDGYIDRILKTGKLVISGDHEKAIDVTELLGRSLGYLRTLRKIYSDFSSGRTANHVILTGGTISVLYDEIAEELGHGSILPVADFEDINFANMEGGIHIVLDTLRSRNALPMQFQEALP